MHYLKQTAIKVKDHLFSQKMMNELQKNFIFQLVVLSSIKGLLYKTVTQQDIFLIPQNVKNSAKKNKKILVLDMDETLVYTRRQTKPSHNNFKVVNYDNTTMFVQSRPLLKDFLQAVSTIFEVHIYTAGNKSYADAVIDEIDKQKVIKKRFYRESCKKSNGNYYKDLKHLKRVSKCKGQMILVDDNTISIGHNYPFSIKIKQFEGDQTDRQLVSIFKNLLKFHI